MHILAWIVITFIVLVDILVFWYDNFDSTGKATALKNPGLTQEKLSWAITRVICILYLFYHYFGL